MEYEQAERELGHQNSFRSERAWPTFHLRKICILDVDVIGNTNFHGKDF